MVDITFDDLQGLWLVKEFNLFIGRQSNPTFGNLVDILGKGKDSLETKNLQLSEITPDNTRMLIFSDDNSIEIWHLNKPEMTITVNNNKYDLNLRP